MAPLKQTIQNANDVTSLHPTIIPPAKFFGYFRAIEDAWREASLLLLQVRVATENEAVTLISVAMGELRYGLTFAELGMTYSWDRKQRQQE